MAIVRLLERVWIPLVVLLVIATGGFVVSRIHGRFGSEQRPTYSNNRPADARPVSPKQVRYEVFGAAGTVADISYFNASAEPQHVDGAQLPWSMTMSVNSPSVVADVVAQGDSGSIGCRILVDSEVKVERISDDVNAFTHCLVTGG